MNILFAKPNSQRKKEFRIDTLIYKKGGKTVVKKYINNRDAQNHLLQYVKNVKIIKRELSTVFLPKILTQKNSFLEIEYINSPSLESIIENSLIEKNFDKAQDCILTLKAVLDSFKSLHVCPYNDNNFHLNFDPENKYRSRKTEDCYRLGVLDLNFDNILVDSYDRIFLLDCEWMYNFPIPKKYIQFRALFYLCNKLQSIIATYCSEDFPCYEVLLYFLIPVRWFTVLGTSQDEIEKYMYFEHVFQNKIQLINHKFDHTRILKKKGIIKKRYSLNLENYLYAKKKDNEIEIGPKLLYIIKKYYKLKGFFLKK